MKGATIDFCNEGKLAASLRYTVNTLSAGGSANQDHAVAAPGSFKHRLGHTVTNNSRGSAGNVDFLELPGGAERKKAAVGRPKPSNRVVGSGKGSRFEGVEFPNPQKLAAIRRFQSKRNHEAVWRHRNGFHTKNVLIRC